MQSQVEINKQTGSNSNQDAEQNGAAGLAMPFCKRLSKKQHSSNSNFCGFCPVS